LSKGLTLEQFFIIESAATFVGFISQIPTGMFSDKISRKWSLVWSSIIGIPIIAVIIFSQSFWAILIAMAIGAIGNSFFDGADIAMLYDTAVSIGKKDEFKKINGNFKWFGSWAGAIGGILGGVLAQFNLSWAWWAYFAVSIPVLFLQLSLIDPPKAEKEEKSYRLHLNSSLWHAFRGDAAYFIFYSAVVWIFFSLGFWLWQPYLKSISLPIVYFGLVYATIDLVSGFTSKQSHKIEQKIGVKSSLVIIPIILAISFILQSREIYLLGFIFLYIHSAVSGFYSPVLEDYLNTRIPSENRATVLSIKSMLNKAVFVIFSPLLGHFLDLYSLKTAYLLMAIVLLIIAATIAITLKRSKYERKYSTS
jgi:MFS family permease